jgi:hypothetical protein
MDRGGGVSSKGFDAKIVSPYPAAEKFMLYSWIPLYNSPWSMEADLPPKVLDLTLKTAFSNGQRYAFLNFFEISVI